MHHLYFFAAAESYCPRIAFGDFFVTNVTNKNLTTLVIYKLRLTNTCFILFENIFIFENNKKKKLAPCNMTLDLELYRAFSPSLSTMKESSESVVYCLP